MSDNESKQNDNTVRVPAGENGENDLDLPGMWSPSDFTGGETVNARVDELVSEIPLEGIIGIIIQASKGHIAPRWLCMSEEAKEQYAAIGSEFVAKFKAEEIEAKMRRDKNDPFSFFIR